MNRRTLLVHINGVLVGTLFDEHNIWGFQYAPEWVNNPDAFPLSPALALSAEPMIDGGSIRPVQWFFDNLLPEELMRGVIGKEEGVDEADAFGLLQRLGAESAGALVLQPEGAPDAAQGVQPLPYEELSARIRNLPVASLNKQAPKRMSLAGAQHKIVVCFEDKSGALSEPLQGTPSTHILKPNSTAPGYPDSVVNETFTMRLAGRLGVDVPKVWRIYVPEPAYIIERFDRIRLHEGKHKQMLRVHVVDGSQVLNTGANFKYLGATFENIGKLIDACSNKAAARLAIFRWILFNTLVGNSDCHLKNISFLLDSNGLRVSPFYDLLSTAVYHTRAMADEQAVWPNEQLAMPVVGAGQFADVTRAKLVETGKALGLGAATAVREVEKMIKLLPIEADKLIAAMEAEYQTSPLMAGATDLTRASETRLLRAIRGVVIKDMLRLTEVSG